MADFLKIALIVIVALFVGLAAASYFNNPENPSPVATINNLLDSFKHSMGNWLLGVKSRPPPIAQIKEGTPTPGVSMTPEEITDAQRHFNKLAGIDMEAKRKEEAKKEEEGKKEKEEKEKKDAEKKKEEKEKIVTSLFPVKKKRRGIQDNPVDRGAVYALGTSPYGPPPFVKAKIFDKNSLLHIENDPSISHDSHRSHTDEYKKPDHALPLMDTHVREEVRANLDPKNTFTVQLGVFESEKQANKLKSRLSAKGYDVSVYSENNKHHQKWHYVRLNELMTEKEALSRKNDLMAEGNMLPLIVPMHEEK